MFRSRNLHPRYLISVIPILLCGLLAGCGGDNTHRVSGKVSFKGQPIPSGTIYFMPDGAKGNDGPTGYAKIENGEYDTSATGGKGAASGAMIVQIEGFDPSAKPKADDEAGAEGQEAGARSLFPTYETTVELPDDDSTQNFDVPAEALKRKDAPETPLINP